MMRIAILGNAGGGKSTLARRLAREGHIDLHEFDKWQWGPNWTQRPEQDMLAEQAKVLDQPDWIIEGLGPLSAIKPRLDKATHIILIDLPLWQHFYFVSERQRKWNELPVEQRPAGGAVAPDTKQLFRVVHIVNENWMPTIRDWLDELETTRTETYVLNDMDVVAQFSMSNLNL